MKRQPFLYFALYHEHCLHTDTTFIRTKNSLSDKRSDLPTKRDYLMSNTMTYSFVVERAKGRKFIFAVYILEILQEFSTLH